MQHTVTRLDGMRVLGPDGEIGRAQGVLFDDVSWSLRYIVVQTASDLDGRAILIGPPDVSLIDEEGGVIRVGITRLEAAGVPDISSDPPVSYQKERDLGRSMVFLPFWGTGGLWGHGVLSTLAVGGPVEDAVPDRRDDHHLRSAREVLRYRMRARDGRIGRLRDLVFDDVDWLVRHIEVGVRRGLGERRILLPPVAVARISWRRRLVLVPIPRSVALCAPPPDAATGALTNYHMRLLLAVAQSGIDQEDRTPPSVPGGSAPLGEWDRDSADL